MGSKHFTSLFAFVAAVACPGVTGSAWAYNVVQAGPLVVPANAPVSDADPNIVAQSTAGTVGFDGAEAAPAGFIQATAAGAITTNGPLAATAAITLNAGTADVTVGALTLGAPSSLTGGQITLVGALGVPTSTTAAQLTIAAATATTATVTLNLGPTAEVLVAGSRVHVFGWSGAAARTVTATLGTAPTLGANLKYNLAELAVSGDVVVVPACGDHVVDPGEVCDDGNVVAGDGCSATCTIEVVDAGADAGDAGDAGRDAGHDAGDRGLDPVALVEAGAVDDSGMPQGSATASAPPPLGDIFADDGSGSCAFAPGALRALGTPLPAAALLALASVAGLRARRRRRRRR